MSHTVVGLRVDVDTLRGTREGVPALVDLFAKYDIRASFFMSVGPDNMGRNLWRLIKPKFLWKMLRSNGASLYGYDILLRGTAWPGPVIGKHLPDIIRLPKEAGHEVGLHGWDHYTWQAKIDQLSPARLQQDLRQGFGMLADLLGEAPTCSAVAGWRCNEQVLVLKEAYPFLYNSDCRGQNIFIPTVGGKPLTPQIPVTLPTYDEVIGIGGVTRENYNHKILSLCKPDQLNVYTIHAEVEGISHLRDFETMLQMARERNISFQPLGIFLDSQTVDGLKNGRIEPQRMSGREGWLAYQAADIAQ